MDVSRCATWKSRIQVCKSVIVMTEDANSISNDWYWVPCVHHGCLWLRAKHISCNGMITLNDTWFLVQLILPILLLPNSEPMQGPFVDFRTINLSCSEKKMTQGNNIPFPKIKVQIGLPMLERCPSGSCQKYKNNIQQRGFAGRHRPNY